MHVLVSPFELRSLAGERFRRRPRGSCTCPRRPAGGGGSNEEGGDAGAFGAQHAATGDGLVGRWKHPCRWRCGNCRRDGWPAPRRVAGAGGFAPWSVAWTAASSLVASSPLRIAGASRLEAADLLTADLFLLQSRRFVANIKLVGGQEASSSRSPTSPAEGFGASATPRRQGTTLLCVALSATSSMPHPTLLFSRRQQPRSSTTTSRHNQLQHPYDSMVRYHKQITYH